jgi:hypothetical protein
MIKLLSLRRHHGGVLLASFLICSLAAGCGSPKGSVTGKVSFRGKLLKAGYVTFTPENGAAVSGTIDGEGNYRVDKVPVGMARISIRADEGMKKDAFAKVSDPRNPKQMKEAFMSKNTQKLPKQYSTPDESGLTCEVQAGIQEHNIELLR